MAERPPPPVVPPWRWWLGFSVIVGIGGFLSLRAYQEGLSDVLELAPQLDKLLHFVLAGLLAFFLDGALRRRTLFTIGRLPVPLAAVGILVPTAIDEIAQSFTIYRTASVFDYAADVAGVVVFIRLSRRVAR